MKTAISVDDRLMGEADKMAQQLGLSRSALVSRAHEDFLKLRRGETLTAKLNELYSAGDATQAPQLARQFKRKAAPRDAW